MRRLVILGFLQILCGCGGGMDTCHDRDDPKEMPNFSESFRYTKNTVDALTANGVYLCGSRSVNEGMEAVLAARLGVHQLDDEGRAGYVFLDMNGWAGGPRGTEVALRQTTLFYDQYARIKTLFDIDRVRSCTAWYGPKVARWGGGVTLVNLCWDRPQMITGR